jgi:predicted esterase YcpF (UPF0227 family)
MREAYPELTVHSPSLPVPPNEAIEVLETMMAEHDIKGFVGTSLGGFYSFYMAVVHQRKALMVNPVLDPSRKLAARVGENKNLVTGEPFQWRREYLDQLAEMESKIESTEKAWENYYLAIGKNDELLDPDEAINYFLYKSTVKLYDDDHRFWRTFPQMIVDEEFEPFFRELSTL